MDDTFIKALGYIAQIAVALSPIVTPIVIQRTKRKNAQKRRSNHR